MVTLRGIELSANLQALITIRFSDSVTNQPLGVPVQVDVLVRYPGQSDFSRLPLPQRHLPGGYVVLTGTAVIGFPQTLDPTDDVEFRFDVAATGYVAQQTTATVSGAVITAVPTVVDTPDYNVEALLVAAPVLTETIALRPNPVGLRGVIIEDHDVSSPIAGVSVRVIDPVIEPGVTSDTQGRYRIDTLPVAATVTLEINDQGNVNTLLHSVDFATPLNSRIISLNG